MFVSEQVDDVRYTLEQSPLQTQNFDLFECWGFSNELHMMIPVEGDDLSLQ